MELNVKAVQEFAILIQEDELTEAVQKFVTEQTDENRISLV